MTKCNHGRPKSDKCWLCDLEKAATQALNEVLEESEKAND